MSESEWGSVRIKSELLSQIRDAVETLKQRNIPKYESGAEFVQKACMKLLDEEGVKEK